MTKSPNVITARSLALPQKRVRRTGQYVETVRDYTTLETAGRSQSNVLIVGVSNTNLLRLLARLDRQLFGRCSVVRISQLIANNGNYK